MARFDKLTEANKVKYRGKAKIAWDILVKYAPQGTLDSYESFGAKFGVGKFQVGSYVLYLIREYCSKKNLPLLNCLIVRAADMKPGAKWRRDHRIFEQEFVKVKNYPWNKVRNPF